MLNLRLSVFVSCRSRTQSCFPGLFSLYIWYRTSLFSGGTGLQFVFIMAKLFRDSVIVIFIVGYIGLVEPRAVNISNMWTLPQEGFSVFYRYFRDKISWLEADAVCQFHHANLVTVDNGVQFDASRAFLKELDVTNAVWIGLKRPINSARFTWTSSKALNPSSGYWAETIPAIEQPLCAVLDPIRDFRWHALRCSGPETAAFLCELPVPTWAVDCTVTSIPSLTVQYMSDSGTVQISRDCGESGTKHISCQGKQDRNNIIEQLQCSEEENLASVLAIDNSNQLLLMLGTESVKTASSTSHPHQQPILEHDILTVVSSIDHESNNKIEINPIQIEDTVKNVINKFNLQDLMRNEQAGMHSEELDTLGHEVKCHRKSGYSKNYSPLYEKKNRFVTKTTNGSNWNDKGNEDGEDDETMMGDQPMQDEMETPPIDIIQRAVKPTVDGDYPDTVIVGNEVKTANNETGSFSQSDTSVTWTDLITTLDSTLRRGAVSDADEESTIKTPESVDVSTTIDKNKVTKTMIFDQNSISSVLPVTTTTDESPAIITTEPNTSSHMIPTIPKSEIITGDHFKPPMLMVKARFVSARPQTELPVTTMIPNVPSTVIPTESIERFSATFEITDDTFPEDYQKNEPSLSVESSSDKRVVDGLQDNILSLSTIAPSQTDMPLVTQVALKENQLQRSETLEMPIAGTRSIQSGTTTTEQLPSNHEMYDLSQAAAVISTFSSTQYTRFITTPAPSSQESTTKPNPVAIATVTRIGKDIQQVKDITKSSTLMSPDTAVTIKPYPEISAFSSIRKTILGEMKHNSSYDENPKTGKSIGEMPYLYHKTTIADEHTSLQDSKDTHTYEQHTEYDEQKNSEVHNSFSNVENYQPYKPNRHRTLTKPEVHNNHGAYIKKILG
ncbi:uncharacterized protein LOC118511281 isoform X2 [Anopheles stephensi]|uniref:uncharacterized protein LOC118511281 isoform X2 n=1 Tax=Anopheles stephensi TaxID=30069 RepID=UPI0016589C5E|nr:uncharacterized protein LOC118511281 isoform X2 [Anopheles stephensi]